MSDSSYKIKIGTRASKLALAQVEEVKELLIKNHHLSLDQIEIVQITTSGDKIQDRNLAEIGGKGLFIKELEEALLAKRIDVAIHSAKDVPPIINERTEIAAFSQRKDARDYFISNKFSSLDDLPKGTIVGTSSARRKAALLRIRPDLNIINFRGNVDTRLKKLEESKADATILAVCGLQRLGKKIEEKNIISPNLMLPAVGQGCLALQVRKDDEKTVELIKKINHSTTEICVSTERTFLRELGADCKTPVGVYCEIQNNQLHLKTIILDFDGKEIFATESNSVFEKAEEMAKQAALKTKNEAGILLKKICC